jgi:excisionase family DNA binding protein
MARKSQIHKIVLKGKQMVDVIEMSTQLGITIFHVRRLAREGKLTSVKLGRRWWFDLNKALNERMDVNEDEYEYANLVGI